MDISRGVLDNLMGRDRNLPKDSVHTRDHYSNSDVCKPFLICFCFNTLFPNTIYDEGTCNKRHDTYLKTMFDNDLNRGDYERVYIKECVAWIERRLQEAEQKTKKNQNTIQNKTGLSTERPRQILDRILAIDKDIEEMMGKAAIFGENGQIDDSSRCLEEVQRLRERRKEIDLMGDNLLAVVKQQKICEICGAIQTINDTEKRIQMHLEGKIHQGFLRLRTQIETLKIRLEILQQKLEKTKEKEKQKQKVIPAIVAAPTPQPAVIPQEVIVEIKPKQVEKIVQQKERQRDESNSKKKKKEHKHKDDRQPRENKQIKKKDRSGQREGEYERLERSRSREHHRKDRDHKKDKKKRDRSQEKEHKRQRSRSRERERERRNN